MLPRRATAPARGGALALAALGVLLAAAACGSAVPVTALCSTPGAAAEQDSFNEPVSLVSLPSGLRYGDIRVGCGAAVRTGQTVTVQYTGWLQSGKEFDSSRAAGRQPFAFPLGEGQVIPGFDQGVADMHIGGKRRLVIPAALAYGSQGVPPVIPPNATLYFDVEVISATS